MFKSFITFLVLASLNFGCYTTVVQWQGSTGGLYRFISSDEKGEFKDAVTFQNQVRQHWSNDDWRMPTSIDDLKTLQGWCDLERWGKEEIPFICDGFWTGLNGSEAGLVVFFPNNRYHPVKHIIDDHARYGIVLICDQRR